MTEKTEALESIMEQLEALDTIIAMSNLIAAGVVTDPETIRDTASAASHFLTMQVVGTRMLLEPTTTKVIQHAITQIGTE